MARTANPESTRKGFLAAALAFFFLLSFMPPGVLSWLAAPRNLVSMLLSPISDPVKRIAVWISPPAPRPDDARLAFVEAERERFKTLYQQALGTIDRLNARIQDLEKGAAVSDERVRQVPAAVVGNTSATSGGSIKIGVGSSVKGVSKNTVVTTNGDQLVGRISEVFSKESWVTLLTNGAIGPVDGVILTDEGKVTANIRNLTAIRGQRTLQGQVQYPAPTPPIGSLVRLEDQSWPRIAQRLVIGKVTETNELPGGRTIVKVKPLIELERLGEVILRTSPPADGAGGVGGGGGGGGGG